MEKKHYKKWKVYPKKKSTSSVSVADVKKIVKKEMVKEVIRKYFTTFLGATSAITYNGNYYPLSDMNTGASANSRIGSKIRINRIRFRCRITQVGTATQSLRVVLFKYKLSSAEGNPVTNFPFDLTSGIMGTNLAPFCPLNRDTESEQYNVVADYIKILDTYHPIREFHLDMKCGWKSEFDGSITGINQLWVVFVSDSNGTQPSVSWTSQVEFEDIV